MAFKKVFFIIFIVLFFLVNFPSVYAQGSEEGEGRMAPEERDFTSGDLEVPDDYNNPNAYEDGAISSNPNFDPTKVPPQYVNRIPPKNVGDANAVQDTSELTSEQLTEDNNINDVSDWNALNNEARDQALTELGGLDQPITTENPTSGRVEGGVIFIDQADRVGIGTVEIIGGQNIEIKGDQIRVESAPIIDFFGISNDIVLNFDGNRADLSYHIDSAGKIRAGCFEARRVDNADIKISDKIEISVPPGEEFDIVYGFDKEMKFTGGDNNKLYADPAGCLKEFEISGENFTLEIPGDRTEIIEVNDTAIITIDRELGFVCGQFTPLAKYSSQGDALEDIFSLVVWKTPHKICARKHVDQVFDIEKEMTLVDFLTSKITINGLVDYRRYFFSNGTLLTPTTTPHFTPEIPFTSILSHDPSWKKATASVASNDIQNTAVFSNFLKVLDQRENTKRFLVFDTNIQSLAENIIQNYQTISHPLIYATDSIIIQDTNTQAKITVLPPNHPDILTSIKTFS